MQTQWSSNQGQAGTQALLCWDLTLLPQLQPEEAQIQEGNCYAPHPPPRKISGTKALVAKSSLRCRTRQEHHFFQQYHGGGEEGVHFISINSIFKTAALSEKGLLYIDDKAGCIQISATKHTSFLKGLSAWSTQQQGSQQNAPG